MKKSLSIKPLVSEIIMKEQMKNKHIPTVLVLSSMISDSKGTIGKLKKSCEKFGLPFYAIRSKNAFIATTQNEKNSLTIENYNGKGDVLFINPRNTICFVRGSAIKTEVGSALIRIMENYGVFVSILMIRDMVNINHIILIHNYVKYVHILMARKMVNIKNIILMDNYLLIVIILMVI
jgi:hypothetical protein